MLKAPSRLPLDTDIAVPERVEDLYPGLLLFFERPSPLQTWAELFGHEWRHVGLTVQSEDGLKVASYGAKTCFRLDAPEDLLGAYTRVGVARVFSTDKEVASAEDFCRSFEQLERSDSPYTLSGIFLGPLHLLARRRTPGLVRSLLFAIVRLYCALQRARYNDRTAYGCSTFVWAAVHEARSRPLRIPLSAHPDDHAAYASPSTLADEQMARWLCGPTEMWHAISEVNRAELDLEVIDLRDEVVSVPDRYVAEIREEELASYAA